MFMLRIGVTFNTGINFSFCDKEHCLNDIYAYINENGENEYIKKCVEKIEELLCEAALTNGSEILKDEFSAYVTIGCFCKIGYINGKYNEFIKPVTMCTVTNLYTHKNLSVGKYCYISFDFVKENSEKLGSYLQSFQGHKFVGKKVISNVYLSPDIASMIMHEACGHFLEADMYHNPFSPFYEYKFGDRITLSGIDVINAGEGSFLGAEGFDDEGNVEKNQVLVRAGILGNVMVNEKYAKTMNIAPCGNCRKTNPFINAEGIRMTNFLVRYSSKDNLVKNPRISSEWIPYGADRLTVRNNGDFTLDIDYLCNVNLNEVYTDISYNDNIVSFLRKIVGYSEETMAFTGICKKGTILGDEEAINVTNLSMGLILDDIEISGVV